MATPQDSGGAPVPPNPPDPKTEATPGTRPTPADLGLEAAAQEAGVHPERAAELAAKLGVDLHSEKGGQK